MLRKRRFADLIRRQLDVFAQDEANNIFVEVRERKALYDRADRDEAEELYGDYLDAVETGTEMLADMRDNFARTLEDDGVYLRDFDRAVRRRLPPFALEIENR